MAFYGSIFSNETTCDRLLKGHARHIACPQRLKYIHDAKDGYIPYVEDFGYMARTSHRNNRLGLYNTADAWRQELMGLAQQVQSALVPLKESRASLRRSKRNGSSIPAARLEDNDEEYVSKRLLSRRANTRNQHSCLPKLRIAIDENDEETPNGNKKQDAGIWLLPILCHILQVDNIVDAQEWLVNANPTEKRLAMELISRTMYDMQIHENEFVSDSFVTDHSSSSSNFNNLYWPYKFWQYQNQSKILVDTHDTCERATSPVRFLTPLKRLSASSISNRSNASSTDTRLTTPMWTNTSHSSRRNHRTLTANARGKTPLI